MGIQSQHAKKIKIKSNKLVPRRTGGGVEWLHVEKGTPAHAHVRSWGLRKDGQGSLPGSLCSTLPLCVQPQTLPRHTGKTSLQG